MKNVPVFKIREQRKPPVVVDLTWQHLGEILWKSLEHVLFSQIVGKCENRQGYIRIPSLLPNYK